MATGGQIDTDILSDEIFDVLCSMCINQGINAEADKFCVDCDDYFCVHCVKVHSKVPLCAGHKVLDKSQVKSGTSKGLPRAQAERCDRHSHNQIDMYCQNHDKVGCSTCMAVDHRSCQDTCLIPEFIQNNKYQRASRDIQTELKGITKTLAKQASKFKQDKRRLLKRKAELVADIRKFRQEINDQLDQLEKNSVDEIEDKVKCLEKKIEESLKQLQAHKAKVTLANDKLACPNKDQAVVFVNVKMAEDATNAAKKCVEDLKMKGTVEQLVFQPERTILTQLEQNITLGSQAENSIKKASSLFQIRGEESYYIKVQLDKEDCYITSICCLEDGTIILVDYKNKKLKQIHRYNYTVTDYCDLPVRPWQVCSISNTDVALTLPLQHEVHFISVEEKMKRTNKIKTGFGCYGLAYTNNNLYISDHDNTVYTYSLSSRQLKQLCKTQSGQNLFSKINSLAVSKDGTRIYVADNDYELIVLDSNGQVITTYNGKQLQGATCCYITETGSLLVSGESSNNVLQFTPDCGLIGEVIKANRERSGIMSVCCNQQMSRMFVCRNDYNIKVYDISSIY